MFSYILAGYTDKEFERDGVGEINFTIGSCTFLSFALGVISLLFTEVVGILFGIASAVFVLIGVSMIFTLIIQAKLHKVSHYVWGWVWFLSLVHTFFLTFPLALLAYQSDYFYWYFFIR